MRRSWTLGRMERLDRAIAAVRREPPRLERGDLVERLPQLLAARARDATTVVFLTAVLGYLGGAGWYETRALLAGAGREGGLACLWTARPADDVHSHWGLWLQLWPAGEPEVLAHADFHGAWLEWLA